MKWMPCLGLMFLLAGCDESKAELESTKATVATVTKERDDLKTEVDSLKKQLEATKAEVAKAEAAAKTATPTPPAAAAKPVDNKSGAMKPAASDKKKSAH